MRFLPAADTIKVKNLKKRKENAMQNPVHKRAGETTSQRPQIEAQGKVVGRDARAVSIRVATPDDKEKLRRMFSRLSSKSIYRRFHHPYQRVCRNRCWTLCWTWIITTRNPSWSLQKRRSSARLCM